MAGMTDSKALEMIRTGDWSIDVSEAFAHIAARLREPAGVGVSEAMVDRAMECDKLLLDGIAIVWPELDVRQFIRTLLRVGLAAAPQPPAEAQERKVGCEGDDGLIRAHKESETCDVCATAEAQAQGGGEVKVCDCVGWQRCDMCAQKMAYPPITAPPSAPVGVEESLDRLRQHRSQRLWKADLVGVEAGVH